MKPSDFITEHNAFIGQEADEMHADHEVQMARADCYHAADYAIKLHKILQQAKDTGNLEGWVSEKITIANECLRTVYEYLSYESMEAEQNAMPEFTMESANAEFESMVSEKQGLWANIHAKQERIQHGSRERMRKPNSKGAPTDQAFKDSVKTSKNEGMDFEPEIGRVILWRPTGAKMIPVAATVLAISPDKTKVRIRLKSPGLIKTYGKDIIVVGKDTSDITQTTRPWNKNPMDQGMSEDTLNRFRQSVQDQGFTDSPEERTSARQAANRRHQEYLDKLHQDRMDAPARQSVTRTGPDSYDNDVEFNRMRQLRSDDDWENTFDMMRDRINRYQSSTQRDVDPEQLKKITDIKYKPTPKVDESADFDNELENALDNLKETASKRKVTEMTAGGTGGGAFATGPTAGGNFKKTTGVPKKVGNKIKRSTPQVGKGIY